VARCLVLVRSLLQRDQAGVSGAQAARLEKAAQRTYRDLATLPLIKLTNRQGLVAMVEQGRVEAPLLPAHGQRSSHGDEGRFLFEESLMWIDPAFFSCLDSVSNPALVQVLVSFWLFLIVRLSFFSFARLHEAFADARPCLTALCVAPDGSPQDV